MVICNNAVAAAAAAAAPIMVSMYHHTPCLPSFTHFINLVVSLLRGFSVDNKKVSIC